MKNSEVKIIAGPCSVDYDNFSEIMEIAEIEISGKKAIYGTRVVGLKSRTMLDRQGKGMGIDFAAIQKNLELLKSKKGCDVDDLVQLPSINMAKKIILETGLLISTEIMLPSLQMKLFQKEGIPNNKLMVWNPATNQLGWQVWEMAEIAGQNEWFVGLKNPKWLGESISISENIAYDGETSLEKAWKGLASFASSAKLIVLIQRGVDIDSKGDYRNVPIHQTAARTKKALQKNGQKVELFFDPSHSYGPKMREQISQAIIESLKMQIDENEYLYDGILVEAGTSKTDTEQHISINELRTTVKKISDFRPLKVR
jgi:hypothetical protein